MLSQEFTNGLGNLIHCRKLLVITPRELHVDSKIILFEVLEGCIRLNHSISSGGIEWSAMVCQTATEYLIGGYGL